MLENTEVGDKKYGMWEHTCMASYMPIPAVTEPPGELMKSLMSCDQKEE